MIRKLIEIAPLVPYHREEASRVATAASRFDCAVKLEDCSTSINLKSVIGLMSMVITGQKPTELVCDGVDEAEAILVVEKALMKKSI